MPCRQRLRRGDGLLLAADERITQMNADKTKKHRAPSNSSRSSRPLRDDADEAFEESVSYPRLSAFICG
jgi:hypothetical protein